jgi:2-keto-4-pentenoate hydratase/2-oxohepta-3-ene-1,7-dioic acid hydratase in catechol pathway
MSPRHVPLLAALVALAACTAQAPGPTTAPAPVASDTPFKLGTFSDGANTFVGVVLDESVVLDFTAAAVVLGFAPPPDMTALIAGYEYGVRERIREAIGFVETSATSPAWVHDVEALAIRPPIMYPTTMLNTAVNYAEHDIEMAAVRDGSPNQTAPTAGGALPGTESAPGIWERPEGDWRWNPFMFLKAPASVIAHGEAIRIPPGRTQIEWECELGVVIGREASHVPLADAMDYVFGYTLENDVSDRGGRGDERYGSDWLVTKSHDTFAPMGPFITPREFVDDTALLPITFALNGEVLQEGTTAQMIHAIPEQIVYASNILTLRPGDVIATGTPPGAGSARTPPVFFQPGDVATCSYGGIGTLENPVETAP